MTENPKKSVDETQENPGENKTHKHYDRIPESEMPRPTPRPKPVGPDRDDNDRFGHI